MLSAANVAFGFCIIFAAFQQTASWTVDLPQVRKYFFEKDLREQAKQNEITQPRDQVLYDNIHTKSLHFNYDKYRDHYADDYKYQGYMEQKVHDAVRNGSEYLEGLRRAIEDYTKRLESCRQQNVTANIIKFRPNFFGNQTSNFTLNDFLTNPANPITNPTNPNLIQAAILNLVEPLTISNFGLPVNFLNNFPNVTTTTQMNTNFTNLMNMLENYTIFDMNDQFRDCMRADLASEHVRRLAELAIWAASELQDKLYAEKNSEDHGHGQYKGHDQDDTLVLRLAWFLDRLAHLTGFDPRPQDSATTTARPQPATPMLSLMPSLISNEDLQRLLTCLGGSNGTAVDRCNLSFSPDAPANPNSLNSVMSRLNWTAPRGLSTSDMRSSASENDEYTFSEQVFTDDDMPLSLPQKPVRFKRSLDDPVTKFVQYYAKYKAWTGFNSEEKHTSEKSHSNSEEKYSSEMSRLNSKENDQTNIIRTKRFVVKKKFKHIKPENPFPFLSKVVKNKLEIIHIKKDEKEAKIIKNFLEKIHKPKSEVKLLKFKKSKRSLKYSKKEYPRIPNDPQMDISYYIKNKEGRNYNYNAAQAALVRAGLEQVFQTGNILVVQRYGSNYNPANREHVIAGYIVGLADV